MANANLYARLRPFFPERLDDTAIETADAPGGHDGHAAFVPLHYTWRDLESGSARIANLFADLALPAGARVLVHADKSVEAAMLYLATLRAGLVYVPLNTAYQASEVEYFIENAAPALVVCAPRNFTWVSRLAFARGTRMVLTLGDDRTGSLLERAAAMGDTFDTVARAADDVAAIIYTSGTTGRSKGAQLTHGNLFANADVLHSSWQWKEGVDRDVLIHALPIFHVHGLFVALHGALRAGARMVWFHCFDPLATIARLPGASVFMGVPTLYVRMLAQPALNADACATMRLFISGGFNVYPAEIEGRINDLPGVAESAVVGVPHADFGEAVVAVIVARPGALLEPARIVAELKSAIAHFKVPKHVRLVDALPRNAMGKVQKKLLREEFAALFA